MVVIGGKPRQVDVGNRSQVDVPADEVIPGDVVRDQGIFRQVARVEPSIVELSLVWFFDPMAGLSDRLRVPFMTSVSVWRVSGGQ